MVKILITAGMDGDEYVGIEAARQLKRYIHRFPELRALNSGNLITIIPLVNKHGITNPLPKHVFPGKEKGSPTERLMHRLATEYIYKCNIWIDLHGGAKDEQLYPFIHIGRPKSKELMKLTNAVILQFHNETIILDKDGIWPFTRQLDKKCILYIRFEAGGKGKIERKWVDTHLKWIQKVINAIDNPEPIDFTQSKLRRRTFSRILEYTSPAYYYWKPTHFRSPHLTLHQPLGTLTTNRKRITLYAKAAGQLLWWKMSGNYSHGETLLGQAVVYTGTNQSRFSIK